MEIKDKFLQEIEAELSRRHKPVEGVKFDGETLKDLIALRHKVYALEVQCYNHNLEIVQATCNHTFVLYTKPEDREFREVPSTLEPGKMVKQNIYVCTKCWAKSTYRASDPVQET